MCNILKYIKNFCFKKKTTKEHIMPTIAENNVETHTELQPQNLNTMTIRIRTNDNLINLLRNGESPAWRVSKWRADYIQNVEIYNFDGTLCLKGDYSKSRSRWIKDHNGKDRLIVAFDNGCIYKSNYKWIGQNPIKYVLEDKEEDENE